jgi:hypothetical protein
MKMSLQEKTNLIIRILVTEGVDAKYKEVVDIGEVPYQANLRALKALDIKANREAGRAETELMLSGIEHLIAELESFRDASSKIANKTIAVIRST